MYKSENRHNGEQWLLYDNVHSHCHVITNIRKLVGASFYCDACSRCLKNGDTCANHLHGLCSILPDEKIQPLNKSKRLAKECNHYMHGDIIKGSDEEIKYKSENAKITLEYIKDNIKHPKYIIVEFETDTSKKILEDGSVLLQQVMHVEADIIKVSDNHVYIYIYTYMKIH